MTTSTINNNGQVKVNMFENFHILNESLKTETPPIVTVGDYQYMINFQGNLFSECTLVISKKFITAKKFGMIRKVSFQEFQVLSVIGTELIPDLSVELNNLYNSQGNNYNQFLPVLVLLLKDLGVQSLSSLENGIVLGKITKQSMIDSFLFVKKQLEDSNVELTTPFKLYSDKILSMQVSAADTTPTKTSSAKTSK